MMRADLAKVEWNAEKKRWEVHIQVGAEVVKRPIPKHTEDSGEAALREAAVQTAHDEGYEIDPASVEIQTGSGRLA